MTKYHRVTTKKMERFQTEPMGKKRVTAVGGIGPKTGEKLSRKGKKYASIFLSICLMCLFVNIVSFAQVCNK